MNLYVLYSGNNIIIKEDSMTLVMQELMNIVKENGTPAVKYNDNERATEFRFEGYYCDFSIYLKAI